MNQEKKRRSGQHLCCAMGKVQIGLTHIEVNTITGKEETTDKKDTEYACHDEYRRNFSQKSNTPLMHGRLSQ